MERNSFWTTIVPITTQSSTMPLYRFGCLCKRVVNEVGCTSGQGSRVTVPSSQRFTRSLIAKLTAAKSILKTCKRCGTQLAGKHLLHLFKPGAKIAVLQGSKMEKMELWGSI